MERKDFDSQDQLNAATYNALGKIVINFSQMLHMLESSTTRYIAELDSRKLMLLEAALGDRTAAPIVSAFFSVFYKYWEGSISDDDGRVMKTLRSEIDGIVEKRNRLMHESWWYSSVGGEEGPHELSRFRVRAHGKGVEYVSTNESPESLNAFAIYISKITTIVGQIVYYRRPGQIGPEVYNRFTIENQKVTVRTAA